MTSPELPRTAGARAGWLVLLVVAGGTLLNTLAGSSITLTLPVLGADLGHPLEEIRWVMLAFLVTVTVAMLPAGRLGDLIGHRRLYIAGFLLFAITSAVCGLARSLVTLVTARIAQALAGALIMAAGPALITTSLPPQQRGRSLGLLGSATYVGLTFGPPLGGWLLAVLGWRWVFFINVPIAVLVAGAAQLLLPPGQGAHRVRFDLGGTLALILGGPLLLLALTEGHRWGWGAPLTIVSLGLGAASLLFFLLLQRARPEPLLDLGLFRSLTFSSATLSALCNYVAIFVPIILLPYYLAEGIRISAAQAGLILSAQPLLMALTASPSGWLSDHVGTRGLAALGMLLLAAGIWALAGVGPQSSSGTVALWLALTGLGIGLFISPNSSALMGSAPRRQQGVAGAVMAVARTLGMMLGVTAGTELFRAAGGQTGRAWQRADFAALRTAFLLAAAVALLGAVLSLLTRRVSHDHSS